jgi:hypothetical protein
VFQGQSGVFTFYALHEKQQSRLSKTNLFGPNRNSERKPLLSLVRDCYKEYFQRFFGIIPVQLPPSYKSSSHQRPQVFFSGQIIDVLRW